MDVLDMVLRLSGAVYILGALAGLRGAQLDHVLDQALSGITLKPVRRVDQWRRALLIATSMTYGAAGAALALLNLWSVPLLGLGLVLIGVYWVWVAEASEAALGRQWLPTLLYVSVGALAAWFALAGRLAPLHDPAGLLGVSVTLAALAVYGARHMFWSARRVEPQKREPSNRTAPEVIPARHVRLEPRVGDWALLDIERDRRISPFSHLGEDIGLWIELWEEAVGLDEDELTEIARFETPEAEVRHRREGERIVAELERHYGAGNVEGPVYPEIIKYGPWPG